MMQSIRSFFTLISLTVFKKAQEKEKKIIFWIQISVTLSFIFFLVTQLLRYYAMYYHSYDFGLFAVVARNAALNGHFYNDTKGENYLGDHFSPILFFIGQLFRLWDDPVVLFIFANACFLISFFLVFYLSKKILKNNILAIFLGVLFFLSPFVHRFNCYQFHMEVVLIPIILGLFYVLHQKKTLNNNILIVILWAFACIVKENIPFFMTFVAAWLFFFKKERRKLALLLFIASCGYFVFAQKWQATVLDSSLEPYIGRYSHLGNSKLDILKNLILSPNLWLEKLFSSEGKTTIRNVLLSFLFLPLFAPKEILLFILPLLQNMLANNYWMANLDRYYSYSTLPFLTYSAIMGTYHLQTVITSKKILKKIKHLWHFCNQVYWRRLSCYLLFFLLGGFFILKNINTYYKIVHKGMKGYQLKIDKKGMAKRKDLEKNIKSLLKKKDSIMTDGMIQPFFIGYGFSGYARRKYLEKKYPKHVKRYQKQSIDYFIVQKKDYIWPFKSLKESQNLMNDLMKAKGNYKLIKESEYYLLYQNNRKIK